MATNSTITSTLNAASGQNTPLAVNDIASVTEGGVVTIDVMANDLGGNAKSLYSVDQANLPAASGSNSIALASGAIVRIIDGKIQYDLNGAFEGLGSGASAQDTFSYAIRLGNGKISTAIVTVNVHGTNDAPAVAVLINDQNAIADTTWTFQIPSGTFSDIDSPNLTLSATLDSDAVLPSWLAFDATTGTFSGTPPKGFNGDIGLKVTASDGSASVSDTFRLTVTSNDDDTTAPDAPTLVVSDDAVGLGEMIETTNDQTLHLSGTAEPGSTVSVTIEGILKETGATVHGTLNAVTDELGNWSIDTSELAEGDYSFVAVATDAAGNASAPSAAGTVTVNYTLQVVDGYVVGATVFADANNNGVLDQGEVTGTTGADGKVSLPGGSGSVVVLPGGTDASTNQVVTSTLVAPAGAAVVTPLTTLIKLLADTLTGTTASRLRQAESLVEQDFGIAASTGLTSEDPMSAVYTDNTLLYLAGIEVLNTVSMLSSALIGAFHHRRHLNPR